MAISEAARCNHDKLFPNHNSTLKATDPELIEVFGNFAFDEVLSIGNLDDRTRLMVILAALIASQSLGEYKVMVRGALNVGVTPTEVKEIVYQAVPYCGIAIVYDFLHATNEVLGALGVQLPLEGQSTTSPETRLAQGVALQKAIFGDMIDAMQAVDTAGVEPLAHPLEATQRLRADVVSETNQREAYQAIAPAVENGLYLVPKVIE